jgi:hypothetical protein
VDGGGGLQPRLAFAPTPPLGSGAARPREAASLFPQAAHATRGLHRSRHATPSSPTQLAPLPTPARRRSAPSAVGWNTIVRTLAVHQHFWKCLGTVSLANTIAAASGARAAAAGAAAAGGGAAALEALLAAAQADAAAAAGEGEDDLYDDEGEGEGDEGWEVDEDGEWEEDEEEGAVGPGEWAGESAHEMG